MISVASLILVAAMAAVVLYRSPFSASNLDVPPDAIEYALGAHRMVEEGRYALIVGGRDLPPRYPPWFSLLVLAPAYLALGPEVGNAIIPVTLFGVCGIVLAWAIGRRLGSAWGGSLAALLVLALPEYRFWGRQVLTDVPAVTLLLALWLVYLRMRSAPGRGIGLHFLAGGLLGAAWLLRPAFAAAAIPFLWHEGSRRRFGRLLPLLGPLALALACGAVYNARAFGSPWRSGYQFWCAVPYDYPSLVLSAAYVPPNLLTLWRAGGFPILAAAALAAFFVSRRFRPGTFPDGRKADPIRTLVGFPLLAVGPVLVLHLAYFFSQTRFFLPATVVCAVVLGSLAGRRLAGLRISALVFALAAAALAVAVFSVRSPDRRPWRRVAVERIREHTPDSALVISALEPAYVEYLAVRGSHRRVLPVSRRVEYASKAVSRFKIAAPDPPPTGCWDQRCPGLLRGGAEEAVPFVVSEKIDWIQDEIAGGTPVFLDASALNSKDAPVLALLGERFESEWIAEDLYRLRLRLRPRPQEDQGN